MSSDLISIAASGARAARAALDVTANNIANAQSEGYVRRTASLLEVASARSATTPSDLSLAGVRIAGITRNVDAFKQSEARRTGSDTARADAELAGLQNINSAVDNTGIFNAITGFESALNQLATDPTSTSLRAATIQTAKTLSDTFNIGARELASAGNLLRFEATDGVARVNDIASQLAQTNLRLVAAGGQTNDQAALLDQRDQLLGKLANLGDIATTFNTDGTVRVQIGGDTGPVLVNGGTPATLTSTTAPDGTIGLAVGASTVSLTGGALAGKQLALTKLAQVNTSLDTLAASLITTVNTAQGNGIDLAGSAGQPLFSGTTAATIAAATSDGSKIATAPAGAGANSRNPGNLTALQAALTAADPAGDMDALLFDVSATVASRQTTRDALNTISGSAKTMLLAQSGVDLDQEAVNLVKYQQAFQASGKVLEIASSLFETLLAIR